MPQPLTTDVLNEQYQQHGLPWLLHRYATQYATLRLFAARYKLPREDYEFITRYVDRNDVLPRMVSQ